ncbi:hypothetical protein K469DRAFT_717234 [Zopfia rhizophila CBS 207.26]|uniref:Uncharacterized protein n=1 Tax=Zopfia rhizophila CBS 207.26 TaxID=1314779 RepID=A0A6A6EPN5_9PEZI|nr:hypothetical protein K469DRAFT_717234 [Zopfia rhizophila CBS 207.26]
MSICGVSGPWKDVAFVVLLVMSFLEAVHAAYNRAQGCLYARVTQSRYRIPERPYR